MQSLYGDYPRIISKKRKKVRKSALPIVTALVFVLSLGVLILALLPQKQASKITLSARSWHFVIVAEHTEIVKAEVGAALTRERGGGGYILNDGAYKIAAAVYLTAADAEKVALKLDNATVKDIKIPRFIVDGIDNDDAKPLRDCLNFYETLYKEIRASLESHERGEMTESKLLYEVTELLNETKAQVEKIRILSQKYSISSINSFLNFTEELEKTVHSAIVDEEHSAAVRMRYALCKIIYERYLLSAILS